MQRVSRFPLCAGERRQNTAREVKQNAAGRSEAFSCPAGHEIWLKVEAEPEFPRSTGIVWQDPTSPATASARSPRRDLPNPTCAWGKLFPDDAWLKYSILGVSLGAVQRAAFPKSEFHCCTNLLQAPSTKGNTRAELHSFCCLPRSRVGPGRDGRSPEDLAFLRPKSCQAVCRSRGRRRALGECELTPLDPLPPRLDGNKRKITALCF